MNKSPMSDTEALVELLEMSAIDVMEGRVINKQQLIDRLKAFQPSVRVGIVFEEVEHSTQYINFPRDATIGQVVAQLGAYGTNGVSYYMVKPE